MRYDLPGLVRRLLAAVSFFLPPPAAHTFFKESMGAEDLRRVCFASAACGNSPVWATKRKRGPLRDEYPEAVPVYTIYSTMEPHSSPSSQLSMRTRTKLPMGTAPSKYTRPSISGLSA